MNTVEKMFYKFLNNMPIENFKENDSNYIHSWKNSVEQLEKMGYVELKYNDIIEYTKESEYVSCYKKFINKINYSLLLKSDVHGLPHIIRSSIYTLIICAYEKIKLEDFKIALECIFYHDIGRINDIDDDYHGYNATKKLLFLDEKYDNNIVNIIKFVITCHCLEDETYSEVLNYYQIGNKELALKILNIIKDADALDRVREYPYLDIKYLRTETSKKLVDFAYIFYQNFKF